MTESKPILLVEDDSNDVLLLERALRRARVQHPLRTVQDGEEAIAYLAAQRPFSDRAAHPLPALILLDLKLPGKSGLDVLEWIRAQRAELREIPVIVLTSSRHTLDIDRAYEMGASSYMAKPAGNFDGLAEMVRHLDATSH